MDFNPDRTKQAQGVIFSSKAKEIYIPVFLSHHPKNTWVLYLTPS